MPCERKPFLVVRLQFHAADPVAQVSPRQRPVVPHGANYENSLRETALAHRLPVQRPNFHPSTPDTRPARDERKVWPSLEGRGQGTGPRSFICTDIRIQENVSDRLSDTPEIDACEIGVSVTNGEVLLQGVVETKWARRRAEDLAKGVPGVTLVQNNLRIHAPGTSDAGGVGGSE